MTRPRKLDKVNLDLNCGDHGHVFGPVTGSVRHCLRYGCSFRDGYDPDDFFTADEGLYDFDDPDRDELGYDGDDAYVLRRIGTGS